MSQRVIEASEGAGRYGSFPEFEGMVFSAERKMFGWVGDRFYELWPGGRCVDWTTTVLRAAKENAQ